jgi:AAA ATPase domain
MSAVPTSRPVPFVGLRPFDISDTYWFCGREHETAVLTRKVGASPLTSVVGPSGSGKSSLVRAGVLPRLDAAGWLLATTRPGSAPIATLAAALAGAASQSKDTQAKNPLAEARRFRFCATLRASAYGLAEITETLAPEAPRIVLVVDQFEELFRYGQDARAATAAAMREEGRAYVELLLAARAASAGRLHIVLTMRSDYFGNCSAYQGLAEAVSAGQYLVPLPDRDQLEIAVREPVAKAGGIIEDGLIQRLLVDVEEQTDPLPLFQHTLRRLWDAAQGERRTLREDDYVAVGRIAGSIDKKAEAIFTELAKTHPSDAATLERMMKALTDLDEHDRASRRPQKRSELLALFTHAFVGMEAAEQSLDRVLEALRAEDASFLRIGDDTDPDVDINHEALIRSWKRLAGQELDFKSGWLYEEREDGERWREAIRRAAEGRRLSISGQWYLSRWLRRRRFGSAWARRYGNAWDDVQRLRRRSLATSGSLVAASTVAILIAFGAYMRFESPREEILSSFEALQEMSLEEWNKRTSHRTTMTAAPAQLRGRAASRRAASSRRSARTSAGTSLTTARMPSGTITRSSRYPTTGMKSGIRSIGLRA